MEVDDFLDVGQAEAEALDIVYVAGMHPVELFEDFLHVLALDALSRVGYREAQLVTLIPGAQVDVDRLVGLAILHRVVHQVGDGVREMHLVYVDGGVNSLNLSVDMSAGVLHAQRKGRGGLLQQLVQVELLFLERHRLSVEHRHLQHFLHEETQSFRLVVDDAAQMFLHLRTLRHCFVTQHLRSQRDAADRRLQLVRHVVDEVILDFGIAFLPEDDHDGKDKRDEQHQCEDDGGNHEAHRRIDVLVHVGEVNRHHAHLRSGVVFEEFLRIGFFNALLSIIGTTVDLTSVGRRHGEVVGQVDAVVLQLLLDVVVEQQEIHALLQWLVARRI